MITKRIFGRYSTKEAAMNAKCHEFVKYFMKLHIEETDGVYVLFIWE